MSKCERCGHTGPVNPLHPLWMAVNSYLMVVFLDHMTPVAGSAIGVENFYISWHWFMWWFAAIGTGLFGAIFLILSGAWLSGIERQSSAR